jgi:hypothetical protein
MTMVIHDSMGLIATVTAAEPAQIGPVAEQLPRSRIVAVADPERPAQILLVWSGFACDQSGSVAVSMPGPTLEVVPDPIENCDLVPSYRGLAIVFAAPVAAGSIRVNLRPTEVTGS